MIKDDYNDEELRQIHARNNRFAKYDNTNISKLDRSAWEYNDGTNMTRNRSDSGKKGKAVIKEDLSWIKVRSSRSDSNHQHHSSVMQLHLSSLVTDAKIYESLTPTGDKDDAIAPSILRKKSRKRGKATPKQ